MRTEELDPLLTITQVAEMCNVTRSTITSYRSREQMPIEDALYERTPLWHRSTIIKWREGK